MKIKNLLKYLNTWKKLGFISEEQVKEISRHEKREAQEYRLKLIKVFFVIGAFWIVFGIAATFKMLNFDFMTEMIKAIFMPIVSIIKSIAPKSYWDIINGFSCLVGWLLFQALGSRVHKRLEISNNNLSFLQEKNLRAGTASITIGYILASSAWMFFNAAFHKEIMTTVRTGEFIPIFSFIAIVFFLSIAYKKKDQIALLFSIGFLSHLVGMVTGYFHACYYLAVSMPIIQLGIGVIIVLLGALNVLKNENNQDSAHYIFGRTYEATGLLFIFLSLWIMSIWGFVEKEKYWTSPYAIELWISNIAFIGSSLYE